MAGMGKRLRPHTLTTPKPLLHVAGKPIVQRLVEDIVKVSDQPINHIGFVTGRFGQEAEQMLLDVASKLGAKGSIHYQDEALGTAHAVLCAAELLDGPVTVAFADTLFKADFQLDENADGVLWVQQIPDPRQFGVVVLNNQGAITGFVEKPQEFVSDLAMIGIYYFKDGQWLRNELQYLLDNNIKNGGEFQLPDALRNMMNQGAVFKPGTVLDWMDCGNKDAVIDTNKKVLGYEDEFKNSPTLAGVTIHPPCFIAPDAVIVDSEIGPFVSVGSGSTIRRSHLNNTIVNQHTSIQDSNINDSLIGSHCAVNNMEGKINLGDYSSIGA